MEKKNSGFFAGCREGVQTNPLTWSSYPVTEGTGHDAVEMDRMKCSQSEALKPVTRAVA